jgi:hypothetical protein
MENTVKALVDMFEEAEQGTTEARDVSFRCRDYYDGNQLTPEEQAVLRKRGQPPVVINRVRPKVDFLRGLEVKQRTDPRAFPRTPNHEQGAEAATDAIRYVCDNSDWDKKRSAVWESMLVEGTGGVEVIHEFRPPMAEPEIVINRYRFDRLFWDPHSLEADFSDARYLGVVVWTDTDELKRQYGDKIEEIDGSASLSASLDPFEDKPAHKIWADKARKRTRVVLIYRREGDVWKWAKFCKGGILEDGESVYVDEDGRSECPLIFQSAYVGREGNRHGIVKDMLDVQDEVNKRRSKALHQGTSRQTMSIKGAVNRAAIKAELSKPDGHIEVDRDVVEDAARVGMKPFDILPQADLMGSQFALLQEAKSELDGIGGNATLAGKDSANRSGRAELARQQGAMTEVAPIIDNLSHFTRAVYRAIWNRIRQFWRAEKWIRVTDDEKNVRFVGLNRPVTLLDKLSQMPVEQARYLMQQMGIVHRNDPRLGQVVSVENSIEEIDVDILIEEVPDQVTLAGETFENLVNVSQSMPGAVPPEILIEAAPGIKRDIKEKLLEHLQSQQQAQGQAGQQKAALEAAKTQAETQKIQSETEENRTNAMHNLAQARTAGFRR